MADTSFQISQWIEAPPEVVFPFFVDPAKLVQWMGERAEVDAVEGGAWRLVFADGLVTWGRFVTLSPPNHLVFTWGSKLPNGEPVVGGPGHTTLGDSVVAVWLEAKGGRTLLRLEHTRFAAEEGVAVGWAFFLNSLAAVTAHI